jgi:hypothetical protein
MIEILKQLVNALEKANRQCSYHNIAPHCAYDEAIQAGKQAIAELESQEPVAYLCEPDENGLFGLPTPDKGCKDCFPVYRHPQRTKQEPWCMKMNGCKTKCEDCPEKVPQRTWVGLASEDRLTAKYMQDAPDGIEAVIDYIEAKLKELNT